MVAGTPQINALFLGLEELTPLSADASIIFLRADGASQLRKMKASHWQLEQSFAPLAFALRDAGFEVQPKVDVSQASADGVLYLATRFAEENRYALARGWAMLETGGWLIAAQDNDHGAKRLQKDMQSLGEVAHLSKYHCRVMAVQKREGRMPPADWSTACNPHPVPDTPLKAAPGMFSYRKVDIGSQLLMAHLPQSLSGHGADICAGWGYLSWAVAQRCPDVASVTLFEAEKRALDQAQDSLSKSPVPFHFVWADAARPLPHTQPFDWAVMNPPAHDLTSTTPGESAAILQQAVAVLRPGGKLWLVANRHLPYERTLQQAASRVQTVAEENGFKVMEVTR